LLGLIGVLAGCSKGWVTGQTIEITGSNSFIDSMGKNVTVEKPYEKVITLYSAHTENAFTIGGGDKIIGVSTTSIYPPDTAFLPRYDYKSDPEPIIAAEPDLVIIRPFINRNYSDFVRALEKADIEVISLYPESADNFEAYVKALGMIFGKEEATEEQLALLDNRLKEIAQITAQIPEEERVHAYFESTKTAYRTVTLASNPGQAIQIAGGINVADDVKPITKGSTIAEFGIENLMLKADEIEVYISQRGAMNSGGSLISIPQREGFKAIKAVEEGKILELNEKIISSPTFRYDKGVREIARIFYPELMDDLSEYATDELLTRTDYAAMAVKYYHTPIFIPSSSRYYEMNHKMHTYGMFIDLQWYEPEFDWIETAVMNAYLRSLKDEEGKEYFNGEVLVTRVDLAYTLYMTQNIRTSDNHLMIRDIDTCMDPKIVQKVVDNGYMVLDDQGYFNPSTPVSGKEALRLLDKGTQ